MHNGGFIFGGFTRNIFGLLLIAAVVALQVYLSRSEKKWPGLILPVITFVYSLIGVLSIATFDSATMASVAGMIVIVLVVMNIPTAVLLAIYFVSRERKRKNKEMDKMNIKDL